MLAFGHTREVKRYTSPVLKSVAGVYLTFPVGCLVFAALLFNIPGAVCVRILLSPFYWFVAALALLTGYGLWEVKRWSWNSLLLTNMFAIYQYALFVHDFSESYHKTLVFFLSAFVLMAFCLPVAREIRVPYFFPRLRWWESNPRYKLSVPTKLHAEPHGKALRGELQDIGKVGAFVRTQEELPTGAAVTLQFELFGEKYDLRGQVVWAALSTVTHPRGVGVKFERPAKPVRRSLKEVQRRLRSLAKLYRRYRVLLPEDEFNARWGQIERGEPEVGRLRERLAKFKIGKQTGRAGVKN